MPAGVRLLKICGFNLMPHICQWWPLINSNSMHSWQEGAHNQHYKIQISNYKPARMFYESTQCSSTSDIGYGWCTACEMNGGSSGERKEGLVGLFIHRQKAIYRMMYRAVDHFPMYKCYIKYFSIKLWSFTEHFDPLRKS